MINVPMTLIVRCDQCNEEKRFVGEFPYGMSEVDLLKHYLFSDWRESGDWTVENDGRVFCSQDCREEAGK